MTIPSEVSPDLIPARKNPLSPLPSQLAQILTRAGKGAVFAADEFFYGRIRNAHTRAAYLHAVKEFLRWCDERGIELVRITPKDVGQYLDGLRKKTSIPTSKQHLAGLRHFFDGLVTRHVILLNPALSVRGERYAVVEGKTPQISVAHARQLLASVDASHLVGLRDRAIIAILIYTASRAGAVATLRRGSFYQAGDQQMLHFDEKGGKSREIPVRHDLENMIVEYIHAAGILNAPSDTVLFRTAFRKTGTLTKNNMCATDICRLVKRRLKDASLPSHLSPHSFRVTTITDLLEQGVPLENVQHLVGHADPRTTRLYDRRDRKITRNIVERISI